MREETIVGVRCNSSGLEMRCWKREPEGRGNQREESQRGKIIADKKISFHFHSFIRERRGETHKRY